MLKKGRSSADRYIAWARLEGVLAPIGVSPENEAQARQIGRLAHVPDTAKRVWEEVGAAHGGKHPSQALEKAVDRALGRVSIPEGLDPEEHVPVYEEVVERFGGIQREYPKDAKPGHLQAAKKSAKRAKNEREKAEARAARPPLVGTGAPSVEIHHCEVADFHRHVGERSVDLICTDPPYAKEHLPLFSELGRFAKYALKPTGLLVSYLGNYHEPEARRLIMEHVPWWWQLVALHRQKEGAHGKGFSLDHKPIGVFGTPGEEFAKTQRPSVIGGGGGDKEHHEWGQPIDEALHIIEMLTEPGDLVADPFVGGGTTAAAAKRLGRRCVAGEKDWDTYQDALERVRDEPGLVEAQRAPRGRVATSAPPKAGDGRVPARVPAPKNDAERLLRVLEALEDVPGDVVVLRPQDIPA